MSKQPAAKKPAMKGRLQRHELKQLEQLAATLQGNRAAPVTKLRAMKQAPDLLKRAIDHSIEEARADGEPWAAIGAALGVSPQGAMFRSRAHSQVKPSPLD